MKQRFNLAGEDQFLGRTGGGNRRLCEMDDLRVVDRDSSPSVALVKSLRDRFRGRLSDQPCRRKQLQEAAHRNAKHIHELFQFWEGGLEDPFNVVLHGRDHLEDRLSFSCQIFQVSGLLRGRGPVD